jgi:cysteinyl-tRNA synthetase
VDSLKALFNNLVHDILGLRAEEESGNDRLAGVINLLLDMRQEAKEKKEWDASDRIRNRLTELGITVKDRKDGYDWEISH